MSAKTVERLRKICLALPEAVEKSFGGHTAPSFRVRDKIFAMISEKRDTMQVKAGPGAQDVLVHSDPVRFFVPRYTGHNGWVGVRLDAAIDWAIVEDLIHESYCLTAPKRLAGQVT